MSGIFSNKSKMNTAAVAPNGASPTGKGETSQKGIPKNRRNKGQQPIPLDVQNFESIKKSQESGAEIVSEIMSKIQESLDGDQNTKAKDLKALREQVKELKQKAEQSNECQDYKNVQIPGNIPDKLFELDSQCFQNEQESESQWDCEGTGTKSHIEKAIELIVAEEKDYSITYNLSKDIKDGNYKLKQQMAGSGLKWVQDVKNQNQYVQGCQIQKLPEVSGRPQTTHLFAIKNASLVVEKKGEIELSFENIELDINVQIKRNLTPVELDMQGRIVTIRGFNLKSKTQSSMKNKSKRNYKYRDETKYPIQENEVLIAWEIPDKKEETKVIPLTKYNMASSILEPPEFKPKTFGEKENGSKYQFKDKSSKYAQNYIVNDFKKAALMIHYNGPPDGDRNRWAFNLDETDKVLTPVLAGPRKEYTEYSCKLVEKANSWIFMWGTKKDNTASYSNDKPKRKDDEHEKKIRNQNHYKPFKTLRSHDLIQNNLLKMLYFHSYQSHKNIPLMYSRYLQNLYEDREGVCFTDLDQMRAEKIKLNKRQKQEEHSQLLLHQFHQRANNDLFKKRMQNRLSDHELKIWQYFFIHHIDPVDGSMLDYKTYIKEFDQVYKNQKDCLEFDKIRVPIFNQLEQATLQIPIVLCQKETPIYFAVFDIAQKEIISDFVHINLTDQAKWSLQGLFCICQSSDINYKNVNNDDQVIQQSISDSFSSFTTLLDKNDERSKESILEDQNFLHSVKYQLPFYHKETESMEIQEFKITCLNKNDQDQAQTSAKVKLVGLKQVFVKNDLLSEHIVLLPKFNEEMATVGTQIAINKSKLKQSNYFNDNKIALLDFEDLINLQQKQKFLLVDQTVNEINELDQILEKDQQDDEDDQYIASDKKNARAESIEKIMFKKIDDNKRQEKQLNKESQEKVDDLREIKKKERIKITKDVFPAIMAYTRYSSSHYMNKIKTCDRSKNGQYKACDIEAISVEVEFEDSKDNALHEMHRQTKLKSYIKTILNMVPNNAAIEIKSSDNKKEKFAGFRDEIKDEKNEQKYMEHGVNEDLFRPFECLQGQCPAVCLVNFPEQLLQCIREEKDKNKSKTEQYEFPSLIQELFLEALYDTCPDPGALYIQKDHKDPAIKKKSEDKEKMLQDYGVLRKRYEIFYDLNMSSILLQALDPDYMKKDTKQSGDILLKMMFESEYKESYQRMVMQTIHLVMRYTEDYRYSIKVQYYDQMMITKWKDENSDDKQKQILDDEVIQFARRLEHDTLDQFSNEQITMCTFNYTGNMSLNQDQKSKAFIEECAKQINRQMYSQKTQLQNVQESSSWSKKLYQDFLNLIKGSNEKDEYLVNYALMDLREQSNHKKEINEMWLAEVVSDIMDTQKNKIEEMHFIMKIIDSQFQQTLYIAQPVMFCFVIFDLLPLITQMLITDETWFFWLTLTFTFINIFPFGLIEVIQVYNYNETQYFQDYWNFSDVINVLFTFTYSVISLLRQEEIVEMNRMYINSSDSEEFYAFRQRFNLWFFVILLRVVLLIFGLGQVLNQIRMFTQFGKLVRLFIHTVEDTVNFIAFLFIWITFTFLMFIVLRVQFNRDDYLGFSDFIIIFVQTYRNFIGDIDVPDSSMWLNDENWAVDNQSLVILIIIWLIWLLVTYFGVIIILNFLIALISQSYEEVMTQQKMHLYKNKADLNKVFIFLKFKFQEFFNKKEKQSFNVIVMAYEEKELQIVQWDGLINTIIKEFKVETDQIKKTNQNHHTQNNFQFDQIIKNLASNKEKIQESQNQLIEKINSAKISGGEAADEGSQNKQKLASADKIEDLITKQDSKTKEVIDKIQESQNQLIEKINSAKISGEEAADEGSQNKQKQASADKIEDLITKQDSNTKEVIGVKEKIQEVKKEILDDNKKEMDLVKKEIKGDIDKVKNDVEELKTNIDEMKTQQVQTIETLKDFIQKFEKGQFTQLRAKTPAEIKTEQQQEMAKSKMENWFQQAEELENQKSAAQLPSVENDDVDNEEGGQSEIHQI